MVFFFLLAEMVNFPLCRSCLFVAHKRFESDWHVVSSLTWRRGRQGPPRWPQGTAFASVGEVSAGLCVGKGLGTMLWVEPLISIPVKAFGALMGGGALPFGVEGVKKMSLRTNLPFMSVFSKLCFIKRQSHFPDTVAALLWPSLKGTCYPKGMVFFLEEITLLSLPPACFMPQPLISVRINVSLCL